MRGDVVDGFYGKEGTSYKGITPSLCTKLTKKCEKRMIKWIKQFTNCEINSLKDFKIENKNDDLTMAEEFQFEKGFGVDPNAEDFLNDASDDELEGI